jgi:hypothetical protein
MARASLPVTSIERVEHGAARNGQSNIAPVKDCAGLSLRQVSNFGDCRKLAQMAAEMWSESALRDMPRPLNAPIESAHDHPRTVSSLHCRKRMMKSQIARRSPALDRSRAPEAWRDVAPEHVAVSWNRGAPHSARPLTPAPLRSARFGLRPKPSPRKRGEASRASIKKQLALHRARCGLNAVAFAAVSAASSAGSGKSRARSSRQKTARSRTSSCAAKPAAPSRR